MDKLFIIIFNMTFTASFVLLVIVMAKVFLKKYLSSFVGREKTKIKRTEEIQRLIDKYRES